MKNVETKLQDLIISKYGSIRAFTIKIDMSYSTMNSILKRGVGNSSVANIIKICKALGISADELADGNIVPLKHRKINDTSSDVDEILEDTKRILQNADNLTLAGDPISDDNINHIINAMDVGVELVKRFSEKS